MLVFCAIAGFAQAADPPAPTVIIIQRPTPSCTGRTRYSVLDPPRAEFQLEPYQVVWFACLTALTQGIRGDEARTAVPAALEACGSAPGRRPSTSEGLFKGWKCATTGVTDVHHYLVEDGERVVVWSGWHGFECDPPKNPDSAR